MRPSPAVAVFRDHVFDRVLGGGGIKGAGHCGFAKACYERGVRFGDTYCVSAGSLAGALLLPAEEEMNGLSVDTLYEVFMSELDKFGRAAFAKLLTCQGLRSIATQGGAVDLKPFLNAMIERHQLRARKDLKIIAAHWRWRSGRLCPYVFQDEYDLCTAINASCAMPPLIKPVRMHAQGRSRFLIDGGAWHTAPHHFCRRPALISRLGPARIMPANKLSTTDAIIHRAEMTVAPVRDLFTNEPDPAQHLLIDCGMDAVGAFTLNLSDQACDAMFRHGYEQTSRALDQLEHTHRTNPSQSIAGKTIA
jgi:hypothetical protein